MKLTLAFMAFGMLFSACDKMIETPPENELLVEDAIKTEEDLQRLLNGAYNELANTFGGFAQLFAEFQADHLNNPTNNDYKEVYNHNTLFFNSTVGSFYGNLYRIIFKANFVKDHFYRVPHLENTAKLRMEGEALFLRAFCHFTAVRMFAHPYGYTSDHSHPGIAIANQVSSTPFPRKSVQEAYTSIITDLNKAINLLPENNGNYANKWAATALLAQVQFQMGNYGAAAISAESVINSGAYQLSDTTQRFIPESSSEYIFKIVSTGVNDKRSGGFSDNYSPSLPLCQIAREFYSNIKSDSTDLRLKYLKVVNAGQPNEFVRTELFNAPFFDVPLLHLTQMYLIRAESLAKTGSNLTLAIADVNAIIDRAYSQGNRKLANGSTATQILTETRYQRRIELLFEGDRIHELKRLGAIEKLPITIRGKSWNCKGMILQFPISEQTSIFEINETGGCE